MRLNRNARINPELLQWVHDTRPSCESHALLCRNSMALLQDLHNLRVMLTGSISYPNNFLKKKNQFNILFMNQGSQIWIMCKLDEGNGKDNIATGYIILDYTWNLGIQKEINTNQVTKLIKNWHTRRDHWHVAHRHPGLVPATHNEPTLLSPWHSRLYVPGNSLWAGRWETLQGTLWHHNSSWFLFTEVSHIPKPLVYQV